MGSSTHIESALEVLPPLHHFLGHCFFPGSMMAGPLIPFLTYQRFLNTKNHDRALALSGQRFLGGVAIAGVYVVGSIYWPLEYMQSEEFLNSSFFWKITVTAIIAQIYLLKYILVWLCKFLLFVCSLNI